MGVSEAMLNICFYTLDVLKKNIMYILPNQRPDATDFTTRAFNPAIESSEYLTNLFVGTNNAGHKQLGMANLYVRGSNSRAALKSVPVSGLIFDEFEEHDHSLTKLAEQRTSGQDFRFDWKVSTPTVTGKCIDALYEQTTKERFFPRCFGCSQRFQFTFNECVILTTEDPQDPEILNTILQCPLCKRPIKHEEKPSLMQTGIWVPEQPGRLSRGFHINQLYSTALPIYALARLYLEAQTDEVAAQEFHNSCLGLGFTSEGAKISDEMLESLIKSYDMVDSCVPKYRVTMGVDVGKVLHVEITLWDTSQSSLIDINDGAKCRVIWAGEVQDFEQLKSYMTNFNVDFCVIDAMPETREATRFANHYFGRVRICRYNSNATSRSIFSDDNGIHVSVNRTSWLDQSLGRFRNSTIFLPKNLPKDYLKHIKAPARVPKRDRNGNVVYRYEVQDSTQDHFAHARNYNEIALAFTGGNKIYKDLQEEV